jgi:hypothetical protein
MPLQLQTGDLCPKCGSPYFRVLNVRRPTCDLVVRYIECLTAGCGGKLVVESVMVEKSCTVRAARPRRKD